MEIIIKSNDGDIITVTHKSQISNVVSLMFQNPRVTTVNIDIIDDQDNNSRG